MPLFETPVSAAVKSTIEGTFGLAGKVVEVSSSAKNTGGQYLVKINLDKTDKTILSGMFVNVQFPIEKTQATANVTTVLVPESVKTK